MQANNLPEQAGGSRPSQGRPAQPGGQKRESGIVGQKIDQTLYRLEKALSAVAGLAIGAVLVLICIEVVLRYGFGTSIQGTHALVESTLMPALVFLPLAYTMRDNTHPKVAIVYERLGQRSKQNIDRLVNFIGCIFWAVAAYALLQAAVDAYRTYGGSVTRGIHLEPYYGLFAVGVGLVLAAVTLLWMFIAGPNVVAAETSDLATKKDKD